LAQLPEILAKTAKIRGFSTVGRQRALLPPKSASELPEFCLGVDRVDVKFLSGGHVSRGKTNF